MVLRTENRTKKFRVLAEGATIGAKSYVFATRTRSGTCPSSKNTTSSLRLPEIIGDAPATWLPPAYAAASETRVPHPAT